MNPPMSATIMTLGKLKTPSSAMSVATEVATLDGTTEFVMKQVSKDSGIVWRH